MDNLKAALESASHIKTLHARSGNSLEALLQLVEETAAKVTQQDAEIRELRHKIAEADSVLSLMNNLQAVAEASQQEPRASLEYEQDEEGFLSMPAKKQVPRK